jgi:hypothetical protein
MPVCFQLYPRGSSEPRRLQEVDDELRVHFNEPPDPDHWLGLWYDSIGLRLALGKNFAQIREEFQSYLPPDPTAVERIPEHALYEGLLRILNYLDDHYTVNAWRSVR